MAAKLNGSVRRRKWVRVAVRQARELGGQVTLRQHEVEGWVTCALCSKPVTITKSDGRRPASFDHIVPTSLGGNNCDENLRIAHPICNLLRGNSRERREVNG